MGKWGEEMPSEVRLSIRLGREREQAREVIFNVLNISTNMHLTQRLCAT